MTMSELRLGDLDFAEVTATANEVSRYGEIIEDGEVHYEARYGGPVITNRVLLTLNEYETRVLGLRDVGTKERKSLAKKGHALPHGGFPMATCGDVKNAIKAIGRAKNPGA